jgi:hypothetical protein
MMWPSNPQFPVLATYHLEMIMVYWSLKPLLIIFQLSIYCCQRPEYCENRNDPDLVQAFLKKWWVESDFKAPNLIE